ncbi:MAG: DoxX family protein, partial [Bacteroidota bacterium]
MQKLVNPFGQKQFDHLVSLGLLLIRLVFGAAMLFGHGIGKWSRLFGDDPIKFADPFGLGATASLALVVFSEVICSVLIMLGLLTRAAAVPLLITMLVALFMIHGDDPFAKQEKALLYGIVYLGRS